ncbi:DUF2141 domain-containing protein [Pedobacter lithocola]|uniref:DUF2141 domain-containing protein n=1 Tax=Pedobacter lithocola TaxID=1908239 RepID=A0ABV8P9S9_9SPHI
MILTIVVLSLATAKSYGQETLAIKISNIKKNTGNVVVELYNNKNSWLKNPYKKLVLASNQEVQTASFNVPFGNYGLTIYQDVNENGKSDMNFIGIPKEPIGLGNNYKPFGKPKFESAMFEFKRNAKSQEIKLYEVL